MSRSFRRVLTFAIGFVTVVAAGPALASVQASNEQKGLNAINHIVVIYEENHSFDNLYGGWEGVNGLAAADATYGVQKRTPHNSESIHPDCGFGGQDFGFAALVVLGRFFFRFLAFVFRRVGKHRYPASLVVQLEHRVELSPYFFLDLRHNLVQEGGLLRSLLWVRSGHPPPYTA